MAEYKGAGRQKTANELLVVRTVDPMQYYNDIIPIVQQHSNRPFRQMTHGDNTGLCPFHDDNDPSFHHWRGKFMFHCFGCQFTGDVVKTHKQFLQQYMNVSISFEEVVKQLATQYGIDLDEEHGFEVESPFERAKRLMFSKNAVSLNKSNFTLFEFRQNNRKVQKAGLKPQQMVENYAHLDLVASLHMTQIKEAQ